MGLGFGGAGVGVGVGLDDDAGLEEGELDWSFARRLRRI